MLVRVEAWWRNEAVNANAIGLAGTEQGQDELEQNKDKTRPMQGPALLWVNYSFYSLGLHLEKHLKTDAQFYHIHWLYFYYTLYPCDFIK